VERQCSRTSIKSQRRLAWRQSYNSTKIFSFKNRLLWSLT
jgi:hypothetical protein